MKTFDVLGINIAAVQIRDVVSLMEKWIAQGRDSHYICVTNAYNVMQSLEDRNYKKVLNSADLAVPDGMPLVWIGKSRGFPLRGRVYGPDLMLAFCALAKKKGYSNYFYGGAPGMPEKMASNLKKRFPNLKVVGTYSPPFRPLTKKEDKEIVQVINDVSPYVLWVGLGCPKQEIWMYEHRDKIRIPVMVGVGAAFDFFAGRVKQAPPWIRNRGFEWLYRFSREPKRLWKRSLIYGPKFIYNVIIQRLKLKKF